MRVIEAIKNGARPAALAIMLASIGPAANAQQPSAAAMSTAKELIAVAGATSLFSPLIAGVVEQAKVLYLQQDPSLAKDLNEISAQLRTELQSRFSELNDEVARLYAKSFSEQELKEILTFYKTPAGKKLLTEQPRVVDDSMVGGIRPYSLEISPNGDVAVFSNQGGGQGDIDVINVIDLKAKPPRIVDTISVGQTPEGVGMSSDGKYIAVTVMNGSNRPKDHPAFNDFGLLQVYSVNGTTLRKVAQAKVGHWCQGAAFSKNNKTVVIQCMVEKNLQVFNFDGRNLKPAGTLPLSGGGAGLRTAAR